ncbi:unnamed protein product, partial [Polarella glacialis]
VYLQGMGYEGFMDISSFRDSLFFTFTSMVCSAYCDVTIKLSTAGITLPNEVKSNIHGVREEFLQIGRRAAAPSASAELPEAALELGERLQPSSKEVYFIGAAIVAKGWADLLALLSAIPASEAFDVEVDGFGSGPDSEVIAERVKNFNESQNFNGDQSSIRLLPGQDHADRRFWGYKVLVNPSTTEMLCTVTLEALAMGKHVVIPEHPSNDFFKVNFPGRTHLFQGQDPVSFAQALK